MVVGGTAVVIMRQKSPMKKTLLTMICQILQLKTCTAYPNTSQQQYKTLCHMQQQQQQDPHSWTPSRGHQVSTYLKVSNIITVIKQELPTQE